MKLKDFSEYRWVAAAIALCSLFAILIWLSSNFLVYAGFGMSLVALLWAMTAMKRSSDRPGGKETSSRPTLSSFDMVLENVQIGICVFDSDYNLAEWNSQFAQICEYDEQFLRTKPNFTELLAANFDKYEGVGREKEKFVETVMEIIKDGISQKTDRVFKNGKVVEVTFNSLIDGGGCVATYTDVTANRLAENALQENEDRYRKMVELSPDAIIAHKDGFIIYVNEAALKLLKAKDQYDLIGKQIRSFFPTNDLDELEPYFGAAESVASNDPLPSQKSAIFTPDGKRIDVELDASSLLYGEKRILQLIIRDISARVQIEEFLEHAKEEAEYASQLKGTFLANMSHELRTPLNAVIGFSEVIKSQMLGPIGTEKYLEYAEDIRASGAHLLDLINDILDFSKIESGETSIKEEDIEIDILVNECVRLTQQRAIENDINIKLEFDPLLPQVYGDRRMLKQILINLLTNAIKFTPCGGRIVASVKHPESDGLKISVSDNGIGIKSDDIPKALTPFVQIDCENNRKYQGTGLGLPLSKNLAEMHDGKLELESKYGEGTVVSLVLPESRVRLNAA
ncbi:MAG: ATP-binding protein [Proteobacteria bacterium]|nr:ATP-binding protein [Pseudomonadota bacterium]